MIQKLTELWNEKKTFGKRYSR